MKKIAVVITGRPSYARIKTLLEKIKNSKSMKLELILTSSMLLYNYGNPSKIVKEDGFDVSEEIYMLLEGENPITMSKSVGLGIIELTTAFQKMKPDAVITIADRFETITTAIAASYMNIPLIHIQGGEHTGSIDDKVRHAVTKFSDYHFVSTKKARDFVIQMGEEKERVFLTGCPSIDIAKQVREKGTIDFDPFKKYKGVGENIGTKNDYLVVLHHPVTTEYGKGHDQTKILLDAVMKTNMNVFWFWPNPDAGSDGVSKAIREYREKYKIPFHFIKNMEPEDFLKLANNAKCMVGNSSVAVRECSFLGVPAVNVGNRQKNREHGENLMTVDYNAEKIKSAIEKQVSHGKYKSDALYGDGTAGEKMAKLLDSIDFSLKNK